MGGHRKKHHSREVDDPYAEGWDARSIAIECGLIPVNPYRKALEALQKKRKPNASKIAEVQKIVDLWDQGWKAWEEDDF